MAGRIILFDKSSDVKIQEIEIFCDAFYLAAKEKNKSIIDTHYQKINYEKKERRTEATNAARIL